jgi:hypothetical protein
LHVPFEVWATAHYVVEERVDGEPLQLGIRKRNVNDRLYTPDRLLRELARDFEARLQAAEEHLQSVRVEKLVRLDLSFSSRTTRRTR